MVIQEKKIFAPVLKSYKGDLSKRWRVEWEIPIRDTGLSKRVVKYAGINKGKTIDERIALADLYIKSLSFHIPAKSIEKAKLQNNILKKTLELSSIHWRKSTARAYHTIAHTFLDFLDDVKPEDVNAAIINEFVIYLKEKNASPHKIIKYNSHLRTLYAKAVDYNLIERNPIPKLKQKKTKPQSLLFFNDEQISLFKSKEVPGELWLGIQLLFYCFVRPGEARLLRISNINLQYNFIEVPAEISKTNKTQKVAIPFQLKNDLEKLLSFPSSFYVLGIDGIPGQSPIPERRLYKLHKKILDELKIQGHYSLYSWKHTGVVKVVKAGINIKDSQLQLRHHSLDMVNEYLKNLGVLDSEDLLNKFPSL